MFVRTVVLTKLLCFALVSGLSMRLLPASVLDTLQALDADRSGRVEQAEIEAFAQSQGLDTDKALAEFRELDVDGSGDLDIQELSGTLALAPADEQTQQSQPTQPTQPLQPTKPTQSMELMQQTQPAQPTGAWTSILPTNSASQAVPAASQSGSALAVSRTGTLPFELAAGAAPPPSPPPSLRASAVAPAVASISPSMLADSLLALGSLPSPRLGNASAMLDAVSLRSQQLAARATAEALARHAEQVMQHRSADEKNAAELEATAKSLRQNASALIQTSAADAGKAAHEAIEKIVAPASAQVNAIELEAQHATEEAATNRGQAAKAMERALKVQAELYERVGNQLRHRSSAMQSSE